MSEPSAPPPSRSAALPLAGLLVIALTLRPQLSAIGPLAPGMIDELGVSHAFVGLLTTIPVLCMGIFAPVGPGLARALGSRLGVAVSVLLIVVFGIARVLVPGAELLVVLTLGVGLGTSIIGPMLPMYVRGRMPTRMVAGTAAYAAGIILGSAIASAIAVPLAQAFGGWRGSLLALSIGSAPAVIAWVLLTRTARGQGTGAAAPAATAPGTGGGGRFHLGRPHLPIRRPVAWAMGLLFAMQSWLYYGTTAWLASVYIERGWAPANAALLVTTASVASLSGIVGVPYLSRRGFSRRALLAAAAASSASGLFGIAALGEPAGLFAILLGIGLGVTFTLVLTLPTDISDNPAETGGAAALMFLVGYVLASFAPFALGAVRDATGDFVASIWLLVAIAILMVPLAWSLAPHRLRPPVRVPPAA